MHRAKVEKRTKLATRGWIAVFFIIGIVIALLAITSINKPPSIGQESVVSEGVPDKKKTRVSRVSSSKKPLVTTQEKLP